MIHLCLSYLSCPRHWSGGVQLLVDLLDRLASGLDPEEVIHDTGHQEPASEVDKGCRNLGHGDVGLEIVVGTDDQGEPDRTENLADAAEAIGGPHAGRFFFFKQKTAYEIST